MKNLLRFLLPVVVLALAVLGAWALIASRPEAETRQREIVPPAVRVAVVEPETVQMVVESQGTVVPRTNSQLVTEVSGRIQTISERLRDGAFFSRGDVLLEVDPLDYEWAVTQAEARVAQAELRLAQEEASAAVARREWEDLGEGDGSPLTLRELQMADARAALAAARAALEQAERDLQRTRVLAPFAGRVLTKNVDVGQYVTRGAPIAQIYSIDAVEVRLPVADQELEHIDLSLGSRAARSGAGPEVRISAEFAGGRHTWTGRVVRTDGQIDPQTRMLGIVAEVRDPYARSHPGGRPPLAAGMYVTAEIVGRSVPGLIRLPRVALRGSQVLVVDDEDRLRFREVEIERLAGDEAFIASGLVRGERVCVSPLESPVDGMKIAPMGETAMTEGGEEGEA